MTQVENAVDEVEDEFTLNMHFLKNIELYMLFILGICFAKLVMPLIKCVGSFGKCCIKQGK